MIKKKEKGESFLRFILAAEKNEVTEERKTIYLLKLDNDIPEDLLQKLQIYCQAFFLGLKVKIYEKEIDIPALAAKNHIETRNRSETGKVQFHASQIVDLIQL